MGALQAMQDQKNKQNNLASNAITEKYSGYTGQHGDFSAQGKGSGWSNLLMGLGSGMMQDRLDAKELADKEALKAAAPATTPPATGGIAKTASRSPSSGSVTPIASSVPAGNTSSFSAESKPSFASMMQPQYQDSTPLMLQGKAPTAQVNPWEMISKQEFVNGKNPATAPSWIGTNDSVWGRR